MTATALRPNPQRRVEPATCGTCNAPLMTLVSWEGVSRRDCANSCGHLKNQVERAATIHRQLTEQGGWGEHLPSADAVLALIVTSVYTSR